MAKFQVNGTVALVTGANRGIGRAIVERLLERGAAKVYAGARDMASLDSLVESHGDRCVPLRLDVTDVEQVDAAVAAANDLRLLINNAGVALGFNLMGDEIHDQARAEMEVNYFAPLRMIQRFAPTLGRNGGGAIANIGSVSSLTSFPGFPTYSATKAAAHSLTQASRLLLRAQGTQVAGVYPGPVDTDMARSLEMDKATPRSVADATLDALERGDEDIFPDPFAEQFGAQFQVSPKASERAVAAMVAEMNAASEG